MKIHFLILLFFFLHFSYGQDDSEETYYRGTLYNQMSKQVLVSANIINLSSYKGTSSDDRGMFNIPAKVNDSIFISFLGYKPINIKITSENLLKHHSIYMSEAPYSLEEVVIHGHQLTGNLNIDVNLIPIQVPININQSIFASFGNPSPNALTRINDVLREILNPVDLIYNIFSTKGKDMRRLKKIQKEEKVREILASKFDREILSRLLNIDKKDVYRVLDMCNYSEEFITKANDLQILEAILNCYSKYDRYFDKKGKPNP